MENMGKSWKDRLFGIKTIEDQEEEQERRDLEYEERLKRERHKEFLKIKKEEEDKQVKIKEDLTNLEAATHRALTQVCYYKDLAIRTGTVASNRYAPDKKKEVKSFQEIVYWLNKIEKDEGQLEVLARTVLHILKKIKKHKQLEAIPQLIHEQEQVLKYPGKIRDEIKKARHQITLIITDIKSGKIENQGYYSPKDTKTARSTRKKIDILYNITQDLQNQIGQLLELSLKLMDRLVEISK